MGLPRDKTFLLFDLGPGERSWKGLYLLGVVFFGAFLFAAFLSPLVYEIMQWWAASAPNDLNTYLARKSFPRYFDRLRWIPIILFMPWLMRRCGLWSWASLGLSWRLQSLFRFLLWFGIGAGLLSLVAIAQDAVLGLEFRADFSIRGLGGILALSLAAGLLLGLLEEIVFRGMVLRMFYTALDPLPAALWSALFFTVLHFKKLPPEIWGSSSIVTFGSGFLVGFWTLLSVTQTFVLLPFLNLFLVGFALNTLFFRERSLAPCVGLHAGWVWFLAAYGKIFTFKERAFSPFWGSPRIINGWVGFVLLGGLSLWLFLSLRRRDGKKMVWANP